MASSLEIFDVEQGGKAWLLCRAGIPTASCFKHVMAKGRSGEKSKTRDAYLYRLADEAIYHDPVEPEHTNEHLERGKMMEAEARSIYALENDVIPQEIGFMINHDFRAGCSPDALIGKDGALEIKTSFPRLWLSAMIRDEHIPEHKAQCQGILWISGREWIDLMLYWPHRRPFVKRSYRDEPYLKNLANEIRLFNEELETIVDAMRTRLDLVGQLRASA